MIEQIMQTIKQQLEQQLQFENIIVERPKRGFSDIAIPLFNLAKHQQKNPKEVYDKIAETLTHPFISKTEFASGFLNIYLNRKHFSQVVLKAIGTEKNHYGDQTLSIPQKIALDYSSPNIAKSFGIGHLRSTVIGHSINLLHQKLGYETVSINHLGDWGTQFGKMIVAYEKWGEEAKILASPIEEMQALYVRFHDEAAKNPDLDQEARDVFKALENNNEKYMQLWRWFKEESLKEFDRMYALLNVTFDSNDGESFYNDKMDAVVDELDKKGLLKEDQGATIVDLGDEMPPALIKRSDGATLYITRDLAAAIYRYQTYQTKEILYVVGNEQQLHFKQLKKVIELLGYDIEIKHINFGLLLTEGKKMSTRGGKFKRLEDVIDQAIELAATAIKDKNPHLENQEETATKVAVGAIVYNDLKNERHLDVEFNLENMLKFEGQTGPYLQYSSVRMESILKDHTYHDSTIVDHLFQNDHYFEIIKLLAEFPSLLLRAKEQYAPSIIAKYLMSLAQSFNRFYARERILVEDETILNTHLVFIDAIQTVLNEGMRLLGMDILKEM